MSEKRLPYLFQRFVNKNLEEIDDCILTAVKSKFKQKKYINLYLTDLDILTDYVLENRLFDREFYLVLMNFIKDRLEYHEFYPVLYTDNVSDIDSLRSLTDYEDDKLKPMMIVFKEEKHRKMEKASSSAMGLFGAALQCLVDLTETK